MKKLDSKEALSLLFDGVIENPKELSLIKIVGLDIRFMLELLLVE